MKKEDLKNAYPQSTRKFHDSLLFACTKCYDKSSATSKRRHTLRTALVCVFVLALGTATVFAAGKIWSLFSEPVGNYGLNVKASAPEKSARPEYVKLRIGYLPEGVISDDSGIKYSVDGNHEEKCMTFLLYETDAGFEETLGYIENSQESVVNGNCVIKFSRIFSDVADRKQKGFYEYFESWGVLAYMVCDDDVTDEELDRIIAGLSLEEGTKDDFTYVDKFSNDDAADSSIKTDDNSQYSLGELGISYDFDSLNTGKASVSVKVNSIEIHDDVSDLKKDDFRFDEYDGGKSYDECFNSDGSIISPYRRNTTIYGDGISSINEIKSDAAERHFVLATIDLTGLDDSGFDVYSLYLQRFAKIDGELLPEDDDLTGAGTLIYNPSPDEGRNFYHIGKGETKTISVGFIVDEDKMDNLFLALYPPAEKAITDENGSLENAVCFEING